VTGNSSLSLEYSIVYILNVLLCSLAFLIKFDVNLCGIEIALLQSHYDTDIDTAEIIFSSLFHALESTR
jgi:hypothetical protein